MRALLQHMGFCSRTYKGLSGYLDMRHVVHSLYATAFSGVEVRGVVQWPPVLQKINGLGRAVNELAGTPSDPDSYGCSPLGIFVMALRVHGKPPCPQQAVFQNVRRAPAHSTLRFFTEVAV